MFISGIVRKERPATIAQCIEVGISTCPSLCAKKRNLAQVRTDVDGCLIPVLDTCRGHHQRTVHQRTCPHGAILRLAALFIRRSCFHLVRTEVYMFGERHHHFYHVFTTPLARRNLHIARRLIAFCNALAVQSHVESLSSPIGNSQFHGEERTIADTNDGTFGWPQALLSHHHSFLPPVCRRWHIQRYP